MKNSLKVFILANILFFSLSVNAQYLVSASQIQSRNATQVESVLNSYGWNVSTMNINPVISYKIEYNTIDVNGNPTIASGAVYVPQASCDTLPLVSYQHGTEFDRETVPSNGFYQGNGLLYSGNGYITTLPDYLGMGVNPGIHPYLHSESEATASLDLIRAAREFLNDTLQVWDNNQIFLTGYSQGGHSTMALHKYIETNNLNHLFNIIGSAPMSGPYDLSGVQSQMVFDGDSSYYTSQFLPYLAASYQLVYGDLYTNYSDYYDSPYDASIETYLTSGLYSNSQWSALLPSNYYAFFQDSVLNNRINNPNHPLTVHSKENNLYDWVPNESVRMLYCGMDSMVSPLNSIVTRDTMIALGATDVQAIELNPTGTHETCYTPASRYALDWFDSLQSPCQMILGLQEVKSVPELLLYPNPNDGSFQIDLGKDYSSVDLIISDFSGKTIKSNSYKQVRIINLSIDIPSGIYFVTIDSGDGKKAIRFIKG